MAHQPFSSFPPVFDSFPDLEAPGPSTRRRDTLGADDARRKRSGNKSRPDGKKEKKQDRREAAKNSHEEKYRDSSRHAKVYESTAYFRDTKGDELNVSYGYLHARDVPKYNAAAGEYFSRHSH